MSDTSDSWERLLAEKVRALGEGRPAPLPDCRSSSGSSNAAEARRFLEFAFRRKEATVPSGSRFERGKRLLLRVSQFFLRSQTEYNAAVVETLERLLREIDALRGEVGRTEERAAEADARAAASGSRAEEAIGLAAAEAERARAAETDLSEADRGLRELDAERVAEVRRLESSLSREAGAREDLGRALRSEEAARSELSLALAREEAAREDLGRALRSEEAARSELSLALGREEAARDAADAAIDTRRLELSRAVDLLTKRLEDAGSFDVSAIRRELDRLRIRIASRTESPSAGAAPEAPLPGVAPAVDEGTYFEFEDEARGTEAEIRQRQKRYVEFLGGASAKVPGGSVVDLGCGRGELLELLREAGIPAFGIDSNGPMVERCREKGLDVRRGDLFAGLEAVPDGSLAAVTAAQVVEHLPIGGIVRLLALARRKLAPGGAVLLETINPESLYAMKFFWMDPTHVRPVPAPTLAALGRGAGFADVEIRLLSPVPAEVRPEVGTDTNLARIDRALFGEQDYALFARVPR